MNQGAFASVVPVTPAAVLSFTNDAASPSKVVVYEVAQGDGAWRTVMRLGGQKGKVTRYEKTLEPGRWRWRVTFPADNVSGSGRKAAQTAEGEVTVGLGETVAIDVPVLLR